MNQPSCLLPCCQGKPGELAKKNLLSKPQKQFILSLGNREGSGTGSKQQEQNKLLTRIDRETLSREVKSPRHIHSYATAIPYHFIPDAKCPKAVCTSCLANGNRESKDDDLWPCVEGPWKGGNDHSL